MLRDNPQAKVLILTITDADEMVRAVLDAGARGFVLKSDAAGICWQRWRPQSIRRSLHRAYRNGARWISGPKPAPLDAEVALPSLTPRERGVVQLAEGKSTKEVASHLNLSIKPRNPSQQHYAQAESALGQRAGVIRGSHATWCKSHFPAEYRHLQRPARHRNRSGTFPSLFWFCGWLNSLLKYGVCGIDLTLSLGA
jgi:hypothetical protein